MNTSADDSGRQGLLDELQKLTEPQSVSSLFTDATGLFLPGFTALPAVSFVEARPPKASKLTEEFSTGQLFAFETQGGSSSDRLLTFFTPAGNLKLPPVGFTPAAVVDVGVRDLLAESRIGWEDVELHFVWLPWDQDTIGDSAGVEMLTRASALMGPPVSGMQVSLVVKDEEIPVHPRWGLGEWVPASYVESVLFPLNCVRRLMEPFVFRLRMSPAYSLPDGRTVDLDQRSVMIRFRLSGDTISRLYDAAGLETATSPGFTVFGNALPLVNLDLKAWDPSMSYADFVKNANMRPLGLAGVVASPQGGESGEDGGGLGEGPPLHFPSHAQFSVEFGSDGELASRYTVLDPTTENDSQILFWMSYGSRVNGLRFRHADRGTEGENKQIQRMHVMSDSLARASTLVPCFGGADCRGGSDRDLYRSLMLNYTMNPQVLLYRDTLLTTVRDLLTRLGYAAHSVAPPSVEMRVIDGGRQRVVVIGVERGLEAPVKKHHLAAIQDYLDQRMPMGCRTLFEVR